MDGVVSKKSLLEAFNEELNFFNITNSRIDGLPEYKKVEDFIYDEEKCAVFINDIIYKGEKIYDLNNSSKIAKGRAKHSVISFLLGLVFMNFGRLGNKMKDIIDDNKNVYFHNRFKLWAITSANHDYGYHSRYIKKRVDIDKLGVKYDLFNDNILQYAPRIYYEQNRRVVKNSYQNIKDYYIYIQKFHEKNGDEEINDHGIVGGILIYDKFLRSANKKDEGYYNLTGYLLNNDLYKEVEYFKIACLTICQHNIFKSNSVKTDIEYGDSLKHLHHNGGYFIGNDTPLLALLSLVDTVECVKRFSRKENEEVAFHTLTVLKNTEICVDINKIIVDFTKLSEKIKERDNCEESLKMLQNHIDSILSLNYWTKYQVKNIGEYELSIETY